MRFRFIEDRRAEYPVTIMCRVLEVSPAGYYAWRSRPERRRSVANRALLDDMSRPIATITDAMAARVSIANWRPRAVAPAAAGSND
jgi:hypothetical protein